jgi:hypothetical protein
MVGGMETTGLWRGVERIRDAHMDHPGDARPRRLNSEGFSSKGEWSLNAGRDSLPVGARQVFRRFFLPEEGMDFPSLSAAGGRTCGTALTPDPTRRGSSTRTSRSLPSI